MHDARLVEADPLADAEQRTFRWETQAENDLHQIALGGRITLKEAPAFWNHICRTLATVGAAREVRVDLARVDTIDGACAALLAHLRTRLRSRRIECEFVGGADDVQRVMGLYGGKKKTKRPRHKRRRTNAVAQIGRGTLAVLGEAKQLLDFTGRLVVAAIGVVTRPSSFNFRDVGVTMERAGADATPIVLLINFLIGFVMAYQSAEYLERFGASIYVVNLVGVSVTRELGPLMTAIIVCGRTGAAFAAELGTMKVSEEIDALRTLGLMPLRYLVLPRLIGLMLVVPLLIVLADVVGIAGGMVVASWTLDITPTMFAVQLKTAIAPSDVLSGLVKGVVFSGAIAAISCQQGLATSGGAQGVGRRTTGAVVSILFALIVLDAIFTLLLEALGL